MLARIKAFLYRFLITFVGVKFYPTLLKPLSSDFKTLKMIGDNNETIIVRFHKEYVEYCGYFFSKVKHGKQCVYLASAELPNSFSEEMRRNSGFSMLVHDFRIFSKDEDLLVRILLDAYIDHLVHKSKEL